VTLVESVTSAVAAMKWLEPSDQATVDLALSYAKHLDGVMESGSPADVSKALYLGPHLLNTLRALGGAPAERKELAEVEEVGGTLAMLRSVKGA
jgi:hypothetical protein